MTRAVGRTSRAIRSSTSAPAASAASPLRRIGCGDASEPDRPEPEEVDRDGHRVRGEVPGAGAQPGAGVALELLELVVVDPAALVCSDPLPHVLDGHRRAVVRAGRHRSRVEDQPRHVEPEQPHREPGNGLVAAADADQPVERLTQADELDGVRDQLAADEGGPHPGSPLGEVVRDRDRVELERRPAGRAHPGRDAGRQRPVVQVAGHRPRPGRRDPDERLAPVALVEPHCPEVGSRACPARARDEILVGEPRHLPIVDIGSGARECRVGAGCGR